ncbi:MAG: hypothetical protein U0271_23285 [Polyangiaceae bacterium]
MMFAFLVGLGMSTLSSIASATDVGARDMAPSAAEVASVRCGSECSPKATLDRKLVRDNLNVMLAAEGLPKVGDADLLFREAELDGDASTAEALVDVVTLSHCLGPGCTTLVVQQRGSCVSAIGSGWMLLLASTRTGSWRDLTQVLPLFPIRLLTFDGRRYR